MHDDPIGPGTVLCRACGSPAMKRPANPRPDSDVVCADCGARLGTYADYVALAEAEAMKAIGKGLGPG